MERTRAAIYARFSSHNQRSESIEIQVENSTRYCDENGLEIVRIYTDYAKTGRNTNRSGYKRMMEDARHGLFDFVVIYKVPRIMRNRDEMALTRIMLRKAGVEIRYAGEEIAGGSAGVLQLGMLELLAEYESALDSERICDGIQKNASRCMANGRTLYGWDIVEGKYRVNDSEAAVLRKMKNLFFSGSTVAEIVRAVANERSRNGKPFKQDTVTKLLLRVQNGGTYSYAGHVVEDGMPSLWPKHEQDMIISMLKRRRKPHRRVDSAEEWPLTGKLWCACCDGTLSGTSGTSATGKTYAYYKCHKCGRTFRRDVLEEAIVDVVIQAVKRKEIRENIALLMSQYDDEMASSAPLESKRLKKEIKRIDAAFERIWRAIEDGIAPPGGKERVQELQARKTDLETEYQIAKANESLEPNYDDLMQWLDEMAQHLTPKEILKMFIRAAEIEGDVVKLFFAFDYYGDDFTPPKMRHELSAGGDSSCNSLVVEPRRIELRSILNRPRGSTSLVGDRSSERIGSPTNVAAPSRFSLFPGHTGYVPGSIPLKLTPWPVRGNTGLGDHQVAVRQPWRPACSSRS